MTIPSGPRLRQAQQEGFRLILVDFHVRRTLRNLTAERSLAPSISRGGFNIGFGRVPDPAVDAAILQRGSSDRIVVSRPSINEFNGLSPNSRLVPHVSISANLGVGRLCRSRPTGPGSRSSPRVRETRDPVLRSSAERPPSRLHPDWAGRQIARTSLPRLEFGEDTSAVRTPGLASGSPPPDPWSGNTTGRVFGADARRAGSIRSSAFSSFTA